MSTSTPIYDSPETWTDEEERTRPNMQITEEGGMRVFRVYSSIFANSHWVLFDPATNWLRCTCTPYGECGHMREVRRALAR